MDAFSLLPFELRSIILEFLDAKDLAKCCRVCSSWRRMVNEDNLWKKFLNSYHLQNEILVPLSPIENKCEELEEECLHKKYFNRGMNSIRYTEKNLLKEWSLEGGLLSPMGNGSLLVIYTGSSILLYQTVPDVKLVQALKIPPVNSCHLCVLLYANPRYLIVKLEHAYVCYKLLDGKLVNLGLLNVSNGRNEELNFSMEEYYQSNKVYSACGTSVLAIVEETVVLRSRLVDLYFISLDPFKRKNRVPSLGPHCSSLVFDGCLYLSDPHSILCYDKSGNKKAEFQSRVERGWDRTLQVNNRVLLQSFYRNPRSDEAVLRLWGRDFNRLREDFVIPAVFPSPILLHPKTESVIHCQADEIRCTGLIDCALIWRTRLGANYWNPTNQIFTVNSHFLVMTTSTEYSVFDVNKGGKLFTNFEGNDCRYIYRNGNYCKALVFRDVHQPRYTVHTFFP